MKVDAYRWRVLEGTLSDRVYQICVLVSVSLEGVHGGEDVELVEESGGREVFHGGT